MAVEITYKEHLETNRGLDASYSVTVSCINKKGKKVCYRMGVVVEEGTSLEEAKPVLKAWALKTIRDKGLK